MGFNASIDRLVSRLRRTKDVLREELYRILMEHEDVVISMITQDQLYNQGINGQGVEIADYQPYTATTKMIKAYNNQPYDRVTLKDTGYFYSSIYMELLEGGFWMVAADPKFDDLLAKYGESILGLTDQNIKKLLENYIRPELLPAYKNYILHG